MSNTTLKTISTVLGISISTVSRALKNHPDISNKTKQRVSELANTLDYEPNANAIHLRTNKSNVFGLVVPGISNYFYHSFIASVEEESRRQQFSLMILQSGDDPEIEMLNLKLLRQNRVSGLFASVSNSNKQIDAYLKLKEADIPVIFFDKVPDIPGCNRICVGDAEAARLSANTILQKNKKHVLAIFGDENLLITKKRLAAFMQAIDGKINVTVVHANSAASAEALTLENLLFKPDTVFCMSDEILAGTMKAIQRNSLKVPDDIGIIAISNGFIPTLYHPEITFVETSGYKLGKLAFNSMMSCVKGSTFFHDLTTQPVLVEGGSL
ncbi:MAG: LacI family DNA-binding transcriptional regulator [Ferruginibacter sp.]